MVCWHDTAVCMLSLFSGISERTATRGRTLYMDNFLLKNAKFYFYILRKYIIRLWEYSKIFLCLIMLITIWTE